MKLFSLSTILLLSILFSGCSQSSATPPQEPALEEAVPPKAIPKCNACEESATEEVLNQCAKEVGVIRYSSACNNCEESYIVTVRKNNCCTKQGCDK